MVEKKEIKVSKSYSLPPSQVAWLRQQAFEKSTAEKPVSASSLLESIIDEAMRQAIKSPTSRPIQKKSAQALEAVAA